MTGYVRALVAALTICAIAGPARVQEVRAQEASAQEASPEDVETARALFQAGLEAAEGERWNEARVSFERSYALVPRASTLLNLAAAQAELGALVEARESYLRFVEQARSGPAARFRRQAEEALGEVDGRIARVTLEVPDLEPGDTVEIDGTEVARGEVGGPMRMNPGARRIVVRRDGQEIGRVELTLLEGEARGVGMPLRTPAPDAALGAGGGSGRGGDDDDLAASPWLWLGIGGGVLVLTGVIVGVALAVGGGEGLYTGTLGPGALRFE